MIGEMTTTGSVGTATPAPFKTQLSRRPIGTRKDPKSDKDKEKDKKRMHEEDEQDKEQSIIPPDATEVEGGEDQDDRQTPTAFGSISDEQLEKLADMIVQRLAPMMKQDAPPKPAPEPPKPDPKAETSPTPDPVANWLIGQRKAAPKEENQAPADKSSAVFEVMMPTAPSAPGVSNTPSNVLAQGQPMPPPASGTGRAFAAYCKFVKAP